MSTVAWWLMTPVLYLWPDHRAAVRQAVGEAMIGWTLKILPDSPERIEFARFIVGSWMRRYR